MKLKKAKGISDLPRAILPLSPLLSTDSVILGITNTKLARVNIHDLQRTSVSIIRRESGLLPIYTHKSSFYGLIMHSIPNQYT